MDPATLPLIVTRQERPEGLVGIVSLNRPDKANALSAARMDAFVEALGALSAERDLRAVVLRGEGRSFCGGADIAEMAAIQNPMGAKAFILRVHACCQAVRDCPVPVVAAVHGACLGAGLELAAACDLRVAADTARLGMPEVRLGIPSVVEAALLPQLVGWAATRRLVLLGEVIDAAEALRIGLVDRLVPAAGFDAAVEDWMSMLLAAGPAALRAQKALVRRWESLAPDAAIAAGVDAFAEAFTTDEPPRRLSDHLAARR